MRRVPLIVWVLLSVGLLGPIRGIGAQLVVSPGGATGYPSIQGAIDAAAYGDTVYVSPGIYEERVTFKHGIRLIGAGSAVTVIRHAYGSEEALRIRHASAGWIEGFTIERGDAPLSAPTVRIDAASVVLSDCEVRGGTDAAIDVVGSTSHPSLQRVRITGSRGDGIRVSDGASIRLRDCTIDGHAGNGLLSRGATIELFDCRIEGNGRHGVAVTESGSARLAGGRVEGQPGWGIVAEAGSLDAQDLLVAGNAAGGVRLDGDSVATLLRVRIDGGGAGIELRHAARAAIEQVRIDRAGGDGVRLLDSATATLGRIEIVDAAGDGLVLASDAAVEVEQCTVAGSAGDGLRIEGRSAVVRHTAIIGNRAAGIRVKPAAGSDRFLTYNAVWGNGNDYVGTSRRPSDLAAAPGFLDLGGGDLSLRADSPLIAAGRFGATIGARPAPEEIPGGAAELAMRWPSALPGIDAALRLRWGGEPARWESIGGSVSFAAGPFRGALVAEVPGTGGRRLHADASLDHSIDVSSGAAERTVSVCAGIEGVWEREGSWIAATLEGTVIASDAEVGGSWRIEAPSKIGRQAAHLRFGTDQRIGVEVAATDLVPDRLAVTAASRGAGWTISGRVGLVPQTMWRVDGEIDDGHGRWAGRIVSYPDPGGPWEARLSFTDRSKPWTLAAAGRFAAGALHRATLDLSLEMGHADVSIGLAVLSAGVRLSLGVDAEISSWFAPRPNVAPAARYTVRPAEPEAGEPVEFDASGSSDPDGRIVEVHWAFGDGESAAGFTVQHSYRDAGSYPIVLTVVDDRGAMTLADGTIHVWPPDTAPTPTFVWSPITERGTPLPRAVRAGDRILLDATGSHDRDGRIVEYGWDLDSDGAFDLLSDAPTAVIDPLDVGSHPVTLRVIDDSGRASAMMRVLPVAPRTPPVAAFDLLPATPSVLDPVRFIDQSHDADGEIAAWRWEFGDGRAASEPEPIHRYAEPGIYEVVLRVVDSDGLEATYRRTLEVARLPEIVPVDGVWALLIGVGDYPDFPRLDYARHDAEALGRWMLSAGVPTERIRLLTDRAAPVADAPGLVSETATLVAVREALGWLRRFALRDDLVWIHFSGHGYQGADDDGDEADGVDEFFVLLDTRAASVEDTALRDDEFGRFLDRLRSQHVLITFDSCYSGGLSRSVAGGRRPTVTPIDRFRDFSLEGRLVLSASSESQAAFESDSLEHGIFTYYLLDGLRGAGDQNGDGRVTAWELYEHVAESVPSHVAAEHGAVQEPQLLGHGEARIVLAAPTAPPRAGISFSPAVPTAGGPVVFRDETLAGREIVDRTWSFGDGAVATDFPEAVHVYAASGVYEVRLRVVDADGRAAEAELTVRVAPAGRIIARIDSSDSVVLSLGAQNGVRLGDRLRAGADGGATLEVIELVGGGESIARILDGSDAAVVGTVVHRSDPPR